MVVDSPALAFLERAQQLGRLQQHIIAQMMTETESERAALSTIEVNAPEDVSKMLGVLLPGLERSKERFTDIPLMFQLFFARHVDNFQSFLEEIIRRIFHTQPSLLKRGEEVPMGLVLSYSSMPEFVEASIERRIHAWAYKSIRDLNSIVAEVMNFRLFQGDPNVKRVEALYDVRNLFTHNYGIVNKLYLTKHPDTKHRQGEMLALSLADIKDAWETFTRSSTDIETRARAQFKWPRGGA